MRSTKTRLGMFAAAGTGAAALAIAGFAVPASADDQSWTTTESTSVEQSESTTDLTGSLDALQGLTTELLNFSIGDVSVVEGPLVGDIGSGNTAPIGSGNDTPIGSGNETTAPIGSGNDTTAPIGSGNETPVGSGNEVSTPIDAGNGNEAGNGNSAGNGNEATTGNGNSAGNGSGNGSGLGLGDIGAEVDGLVDDVTGGLGLDNILR